jgi:hypothetical protein
LALGVWQVISGQKTYEELTERDKWNYLILRGDAAYWARIREAVADGSIEISGLSILLCKWPRFVFGFGDGCAREGAAPLPSPSDVEACDS